MFRGIRCSVYVELMLYVLAVMSLKAPPPALHSSRPAEPRATQPSAAEGPRWALDTSGSQEPMPCLTVPGHFLSSERMAAIANQIQKKTQLFSNSPSILVYIYHLYMYVYMSFHTQSLDRTQSPWTSSCGKASRVRVSSRDALETLAGSCDLQGSKKDESISPSLPYGGFLRRGILTF